MDRVLALKQRTSRAESYGIHRIAQQPLILYQSRNEAEDLVHNEKVIIIDDHIQAGAAIASSASEIFECGANLLAVACISAHKNCQYFNIQQDVRNQIIALLPHQENDLPRLNKILSLAGLSIDVLTNVEGMILCAILSDATNQQHQLAFTALVQKYDATNDIKHPLFTHQENSLLTEFAKPKVTFSDLETELHAAIQYGRYTVPYTTQSTLSDEEGQLVRREFESRSTLPWLLFDFDDTLHDLGKSTFIIFQKIIEQFSSVIVPIEVIEKTRFSLKSTGSYCYEEMLLSFIKQNDSATTLSRDDITNAYRFLKHQEPFIPRLMKDDFLSLWKKYRIGIITDGTTFDDKIPKIKKFYGVDIDGYIKPTESLAKKPSADMYHAFCKTYHVNSKPVAFIGNDPELDGGMAKNANLNFIQIDNTSSPFDIEYVRNELDLIEGKRNATNVRWGILRKHVVSDDKKKYGTKPHRPSR